MGTIVDDQNFLLEEGSLNPHQRLFYEGVSVITIQSFARFWSRPVGNRKRLR
jgi:hypothetical protein